MTLPVHSTVPQANEEYSMPCTEALLASTLALMTGYVQACCDDHRAVMGRKIVASLQFLSEQGALTIHFRTLADSLRNRWIAQQTHASELSLVVEAAAQQKVLWHVAPEVLQ